MEAKKDKGDCWIYFSETSVAHRRLLFWDSIINTNVQAQNFQIKINSVLPYVQLQTKHFNLRHSVCLCNKFLMAISCLSVCCTLQSQTLRWILMRFLMGDYYILTWMKKQIINFGCIDHRIAFLQSCINIILHVQHIFQVISVTQCFYLKVNSVNMLLKCFGLVFKGLLIYAFTLNNLSSLHFPM
jgi:hypothetical protein